MLPILAAIETPEDRELMTDFYNTHQLLMFREANKHLDRREDVEDTVYEALVRIIDKMDVFRQLAPRQRVQYALTTVRNLSYLFLRKQNRFSEVSFEDLQFDLPQMQTLGVEATVEQKQFQSYIRSVWQELDYDDRMLLEQKYILRWRDEELAAQLGVQPQSVRMRLTRVKRTIMAQLKEKGFHLMDWLPQL